MIVGCKNTVIPDSVTSIGDYALFSCSSNRSITIPDSVTNIGYRAFYGCYKPSITVPASITSIGDEAFKSTNIVLYVYKNSYAYEYALSKGIDYKLVLLGDTDGDVDVTIMDATTIQLHLAQMTAIDENRLVCADTDKDSKVTVMDATQIQMFIAKLIPEL